MKQIKGFNFSHLMQGDWGVWTVLILFSVISLIEVFSASSVMSYGKDYWMPVVNHGCFLAGGLVFAWLVSCLPCNMYKLLLLFIGPVFFVLQVIACFSGRINGAGRWIHIGSFTFQPSEFTKVFLVLLAAFVYATFRDEKGVRPAATKWAAVFIILSLLFIASENLSTAVIISVVMYGMAFFAKVRGKLLLWVIVIVVAVVGAGIAFVFTVPESQLTEWSQSESSVFHRVPVWVHRVRNNHEMPADPKDYNIYENMQVTHARIAVATSHVIGKGPGKSRQRDYLPQAFSDFIYAIIIEETGVAGAVVVLFLYLFFMYRCIKIASRCKSYFPAFLVLGLALQIVLQAMVNMSVAVGLMPVTGQTLPLISKGGTSILACCFSVGMILGVSRSAKKIDDVPTTVKE